MDKRSPDRQPVALELIGKDLPGPYTEWSWDIKALKSGTNALHFNITISVLIGDEDVPYSYPVADKYIEVDVNYIYSLKKFVSDNKEILFPSSILVTVASVVAGAWRFVFKRRRADQQPAPHAPDRRAGA